MDKDRLERYHWAMKTSIRGLRLGLMLGVLSMLIVACCTTPLEQKTKLLEVTPTSFTSGGVYRPCVDRVAWKIQLKFSLAIKPESLKLESDLATWISPQWSLDHKTVDLQQSLADCVDLKKASKTAPPGSLERSITVQAVDVQGIALEEKVVLYEFLAP